MSFSMGSILSCMLFSSILILFLFLISKYTDFISHGGIKLLLILNLLIALRMLFPFGIPFVKNVACARILPEIAALLYSNIAFTFFTVGQLLLIIWGIGFVVKLCLFLIHQHRIMNYLKLLPAENYVARLSAIHASDKIQNCLKKIKIVRVPNNASPAIVGLFHPIILLPSYELSEKDLKYVLQHELEHYFRCDLWIKLFIEILVCIYWWNPITFFLKEQILTTFEFANDLDIIRTLNPAEKLDYLSCILTVAKRSKAKQLPIALSFVNSRQTYFKKRFDTILRYQEKKILNIQKLTIIGFTLVLTFSSFMLAFEPYRIPPEDAGSSIEWRRDNTYFVQNGNIFDVYVDKKYFGTINELDSIYSDYPVYLEEDLKSE